MMKLRIQILLNATHTNTLQHPPIVSLDDGIPQSARCSTCELLDYLKRSGASDNEINEAVREIEQKGQSLLELTTEADIQRVLQPPEDLGRALIEASAPGGSSATA
jgi:hypothetical protein